MINVKRFCVGFFFFWTGTWGCYDEMRIGEDILKGV